MRTACLPYNGRLMVTPERVDTVCRSPLSTDTSNIVFSVAAFLSPGFETPAGAARGETHSFPNTFGSEKALHAKPSEIANARPMDVVMLLLSSAQRSKLSGFGPLAARASRLTEERAEVRSSAELGGGFQ